MFPQVEVLLSSMPFCCYPNYRLLEGKQLPGVVFLSEK
jgi:hypothetical protein